MSQNNYSYQVEIPLNEKIISSIENDEFLKEHDNLILLYKSDEEFHSLYAKVEIFGTAFGDCNICSLILDSIFSEKQDIKTVFKKSQQRLNGYLSIVKLAIPNKISEVFKEWPYREYSPNFLIIETTIKELFNDKMLDNYPYKSMYLPSPIISINFFTIDRFNLILEAVKTAKIEEYVELYFDAQNISDPVAYLISLFCICESINKKFGNRTIDVPISAKAVRNLVSHSPASSLDTRTELNKRLNLNEISYNFSRNDEQHMKLVKEAIEEYSSYIQKFIFDRIKSHFQ